MERSCPYCGVSISHRKHNAKRCGSKECEAAYEKQRPRKQHSHVCARCGTAFTNRVKNSKFCSVTCSGLSTHVYEDAVCTVCDKSFRWTPPNRGPLKGTGVKVCGRACGKFYVAYAGRKPATHCERCDRPLINRKLRWARFCSGKCSNALRFVERGKTKRWYRRPDNCPVCQADMSHRTQRAQFCSHACQALKGHERRSRKKSAMPVEPIRAADIFRRDRWTCHVCHGGIDPTLRGQHSMMASLDHIIPIDHPAYPGHLWQNLVAAHLRCNIKKGPVPSAADWKLYERLCGERVALTGVLVTQLTGAEPEKLW